MTRSFVHKQQLVSVLMNKSAGGRIVVAIAGAPGVGKSTFSQDICQQLNDQRDNICSILPMDGFHFDDGYLNHKGWKARKGAPHTFDVGGLLSIIKRLSLNAEDQISIPLFDRANEISRAGAAIIPQSSQIILVEGNYLLLDEKPWSDLHSYFDLSIMLVADTGLLTLRLSKRWLDLGFSKSEAEKKLDDNDLINVKVVIENSIEADYYINTESPT